MSDEIFLDPYLIMFSYSLSFPLLSFHRLYITLASTLAGLQNKKTIINDIGHIGQNLIIFLQLIFSSEFRLHYGVSPKCVWFIEKADYTKKDGSHILGRVPTFTRKFSGLRIIHWRMKDRDAQVSVLVHVRMPDFGQKSQGRRVVRVVWGKLNVRLKQK